MFKFVETDGSKFAGVDCAQLLESHYGLRGFTFHRQSGWYDVTFLLVGQNQPQKYIFKIFLDTKAISATATEDEIKLLNFLRDEGLPVPNVIATLQGPLWGEAQFTDPKLGGQFTGQFRLTSYIEGRTLAGNIDAMLSRQLGDLAGRVDAALARFPTPYPLQLEFLTQSTPEFAIRTISQHLPEQHRSLALAALELYDTLVVNRLHEFQTMAQQIHCDMQGCNVICDDGFSNIVGLIDFSGTRHTFRHLEAAIALGYVMTFSSEPVKCAKQFYEAYSKHITFTQLEKETLKILTIMRPVQLLTVNNYCAKTVPNFVPEYLEKLCGPAWTLVEKLLDCDSQEAQFFANLAKN